MADLPQVQNSFFKNVGQKLLTVFAASSIFVMFIGFYFIGLLQGYKIGHNNARQEFADYLAGIVQQQPEVTPTPTRQVPTPTISQEKTGFSWPDVDWGGPQLWQAVNDKRLEYGVNELSNQEDLCTIASIRLNELLELGKLDGHEGFGNLKERRPDLAWIFDNYSTMAEFLAVGGQTPEETVALWENTLGHKQLLTGGEYVWGCIYSQNTFAVAITAF